MMESRFFLEVVRAEGLAHLSYVVGHEGKAAVIDPRRDVDIYVDIARKYGAAVTHIFETHRNEDYVSGAPELSRRTGGAVYHGKAMDFGFGRGVSNGDRFDLGNLRLQVAETPGHTEESISIIMYDRGFGDDAVGVFTGDTLFIGDVGRTDFFPDRPAEMAGKLFDSIFDRLLTLGDHVIVYPAHGAGSVCGDAMADREFSTLGYERRFNPRLQSTDREAFVRFKVEEHHYKPPYFRRMEALNRDGSAPAMTPLMTPRPLSADSFHHRLQEGMIAVDVRSAEAVGGAFIPGSLAIPLDMLASFAGWFLPYDRPVGLIAESVSSVDTAVRQFGRLGFDRVAGYLEGGLTAWETAGRNYDRIPAVHARELVEWLRQRKSFLLLDVRGIGEFEAERLPGARHVYVGELPTALDGLEKDQPVATFCGSGQRAIIAASLLKRNGFETVYCCLGSLAACKAIGCPMEGRPS